MAFEYNGVVYRDLEPQVRYDAEQIKILKQADVTINQNLQTVNENLQTKINSKLTAPTTPTAESAVTMLADGTVATKLLSEIGGGGKLYLHYITLEFFHPDPENMDDTDIYSLVITNNIENKLSIDYIKENYLRKYYPVYINHTYFGEGGYCALNPSPSGTYYVLGVQINDASSPNVPRVLSAELTFTSMVDTVIEL